MRTSLKKGPGDVSFVSGSVPQATPRRPAQGTLSAYVFGSIMLLLCATDAWSSGSDFWEESTDGRNVVCGAQYGFWHMSRQGNDVCCGGLYAGWQASKDGADICCGGLYTGWQTSPDGKKVCCGGKYQGGSARSRDGSDVCIGGAWNGD